MSSFRREVYVEILYDPKKRRAVKRRSPDRGISTSPSLSAFAPSPNHSSRKRRKLSPSPSECDAIEAQSQISPTASEFGQIASGSESIPPQTRSPTFSEPDAGNLDHGAARDSEGYAASKGTPEESEVYIYDLAEDDIEENEDLIVRGESQEANEEESLPVRVLYDFAVYASNTLEVVSIAELLLLDYSSRHYRASGLVRAWVDLDHDTSDSDDEQNDLDGSEDGSMISDKGRDRVSLSEVLEFNVHAQSEGDYPTDPKIYIRTKYAWYILGAPSKSYKDFFVPFWTRHRFLHLLIMASIDDSRITYPEFVAAIPRLDRSEDLVVSAATILGRDLREADLKSDEVTSYIMSNLPDMCAENGIRISRVPLVRDIMGPTHYEFDTAIPRKKSGPVQKPLAQKKLAKQPNKTFLTPIVNRIARDFFEGSLEVAQSALDLDADNEGDRPLRHHKSHYSNPEVILWGKRLKSCDGYFENAIVDGVTYNIGDVVMVAPETMDSTKAYSVNKYANKWWFCQIRYFFEKETRQGKIKMFHALWFSHGSKTLLQETSHSKALYLLEACDDNLITAIVKKCNFKLVQPDDDEVIDDGDAGSNDFHCGLLFNEDEATFVDIPANVLSVEPNKKTCFSCCPQKDASIDKEVYHPASNTLVLHETTYHVSDFVYLIPSNQTKLLDIGQIFKITEQNVVVYLLGRYDDYVSQQKPFGNIHNLVYDEHRMFLTEEQMTVPIHKLDGICYVQHLTSSRAIESWIKSNDHYYLNEKGNTSQLDPIAKEDFSYCKPCYLKDQAERKKIQTFLETNSKLIGFELFSGAGGLGIGMNLSGFVETKYAVEFSPSAAKTYMENHPETTVYCQDSSTLLKHAVTTTNGSNNKLMSLDGKTYCPPLPDKNNQIDFIFGGPPCQSFSLANHSKRRDDIRSTMPCNMLSYVEYYEPSYFLLENVFGFLAHRFYANRETENGTVETEIQAGMVKFVVRTLIALGYQVRFKVLQAAQYGVPQSRRRVIFWGAKRGIPLPDFPIPIYAYEKGMHKTSLPTGSKLDPPTRSKDPDNPHQYAPLRPITVDAAIGDLPKFDWINPHITHSQTKRDRREAKKRLEDLKIPSFRAEIGEEYGRDWSSLPGFPDGGAYCTEPQNRFQKRLRQDMESESDQEVIGQYTTKFSSRVIEATCTVPLTAGACHRDLPKDLLPAFASKVKANPRILYGRMDGNGFFQCAVTQLSPLLKNQWPLHPSQKRIITVREAARCQGFPDSYVFKSTDNRPAKIIEDQLKQIGNAVAVPFALALGKELGKAMILAWEKKQREGSVSL